MTFPTVIPSLPLVGYAAVGALVLGIWGGWHFGSGRWESRFKALQAENWQQQAKAEGAARKALQDQLQNAQDTIARNTGIVNDYESKLATTADERDRWRAALDRLRSEAARSAARGRELSEADYRLGALEARAASELAECQGVLIENVAESTGNADELDALLFALRPQL